MRYRFSSLDKGLERAKKLKDLEIAKELEFSNIERNVLKNFHQQTNPDIEQKSPKPRSDLPKE